MQKLGSVASQPLPQAPIARECGTTLRGVTQTQLGLRRGHRASPGAPPPRHQTVAHLRLGGAVRSSSGRPTSHVSSRVRASAPAGPEEAGRAACLRRASRLSRPEGPWTQPRLTQDPLHLGESRTSIPPGVYLLPAEPDLPDLTAGAQPPEWAHTSAAPDRTRGFWGLPEGANATGFLGTYDLSKPESTHLHTGSHLILTTRSCCPRLTSKETEAQRGCAIW